MANGGRVCLITGVGHIGAVLVEAFVAAGWRVVAADLSKAEIGGTDFHQLDQNKAESIIALVEYVKEKYGRLDCLINNAALGGHLSNIHEKPLSELDALLSVNIRGPYLLSQAAIKLMLDTKTKGVIINITSTAASRATPGASVYCLSKSALVSLTRSITAEYGQHGIRAVSLSPGIMQIPNIQGVPDEMRSSIIDKLPTKAAGNPSDVAKLALFLASEDAGYITGSEVMVDGGFLSV